MNKKILSILLAAILMLGMSTASALAHSHCLCGTGNKSGCDHKEITEWIALGYDNYGKELKYHNQL